MSMFAQQIAQTRSSFFIGRCWFRPDFCRGRTTTSLRLVFLAFFSLFLSLVVLAQHFAVRVELEAPFFPILVDDGFIVRALFFPANDFAAFGLRIGSLLHG